MTSTRGVQELKFCSWSNLHNPLNYRGPAVFVRGVIDQDHTEVCGLTERVLHLHLVGLLLVRHRLCFHGGLVKREINQLDRVSVKLSRQTRT